MFDFERLNKYTMASFTCCGQFNLTTNFSNMFQSPGWRRKRQVISILQELELLRNINVDRRFIINHFLERIRNALECDYHILHHLNLRIFRDAAAAQDGRCPVDFGPFNIVSDSFQNNCTPDFVNSYIATEDRFTCRAKLSSMDNIFGLVQKTKKYFITNNLDLEAAAQCRWPEGHPAISKFMAIPLVSANSSVYAIMGFANSKRNLTVRDYILIKPIVTLFNDVLPQLLPQNPEEELEKLSAARAELDTKIGHLELFLKKQKSRAINPAIRSRLMDEGRLSPLTPKISTD